MALRAGHAIDAAAPVRPRAPPRTFHQALAARSDAIDSPTGTTSRTASQYCRAGSRRRVTTNAGSVPGCRGARSAMHCQARVRNDSTSWVGNGPPWSYAQTVRPPTRPTRRRGPRPRPNWADSAAFPRVFQGMFGFRRTSRGSPIRSIPCDRARARSSVSTQVVQPPRGLSVSSTPSHIPEGAATGSGAGPTSRPTRGPRSASGTLSGSARARCPCARDRVSRRGASPRDLRARPPSVGA